MGAATGCSGVFSESATGELAGAVFVADIKFIVPACRNGLISTERVRRPSLRTISRRKIRRLVFYGHQLTIIETFAGIDDIRQLDRRCLNYCGVTTGRARNSNYLHFAQAAMPSWVSARPCEHSLRPPFELCIERCAPELKVSQPARTTFFEAMRTGSSFLKGSRPLAGTRLVTAAGFVTSVS